MDNGRDSELVLLVGWLDAMRRRDLDAAGRFFDPGAIWEGVRGSAVCRNREEILAMLRDSMEWPVIDAIELIGGRDAVVLGAKSPEFTEFGGHPVDQQLYNVFVIRSGRIAAVRDFALRAEALEAAGAEAPSWV